MHHLIFYFLSNTSVKNYHNWIVYVKIIASQRWDVLETQWDVLETQCTVLHCISRFLSSTETMRVMHLKLAFR